MGHRLSGAVTDHELLSISVDPPVLPAEVESHALAASREKALTITDDRRMLLAACAVEVERELQRIVWPGSPAERTSTSDRHRARPWLPCAVLRALPDDALSVAHVGAAVERRGAGLDDADGWHGFRLRSQGRASSWTWPGIYEIVASLTAPTKAPPNTVEAVARLWAYRETLRPGDLSEVTSDQQVLSGAMMKSGAAEVLRGETWRLSL